MQGMNLEKAVFTAEEREDLWIKVKGLRVGCWYHIRPLINYRNGRVSGRLQTGNYKIKAINYSYGPLSNHSNTYFQVEGDDRWYQFGEWLIFTYADEAALSAAEEK